MSQMVTKLAPKRIQNGYSCLLSFKLYLLPICGIISPTNPSNPEKLTTDPANSAANNKNNILTFFTGKPNPCAISSPKQ